MSGFFCKLMIPPTGYATLDEVTLSVKRETPVCKEENQYYGLYLLYY